MVVQHRHVSLWDYLLAFVVVSCTPVSPMGHLSLSLFLLTRFTPPRIQLVFTLLQVLYIIYPCSCPSMQSICDRKKRKVTQAERGEISTHASVAFTYLLSQLFSLNRQWHYMQIVPLQYVHIALSLLLSFEPLIIESSRGLTISLSHTTICPLSSSCSWLFDLR